MKIETVAEVPFTNDYCDGGEFGGGGAAAAAYHGLCTLTTLGGRIIAWVAS